MCLMAIHQARYPLPECRGKMKKLKFCRLCAQKYTGSPIGSTSENGNALNCVFIKKILYDDVIPFFLKAIKKIATLHFFLQCRQTIKFVSPQGQHWLCVANQRNKRIVANSYTTQHSQLSEYADGIEVISYMSLVRPFSVAWIIRRRHAGIL